MFSDSHMSIVTLSDRFLLSPLYGWPKFTDKWPALESTEFKQKLGNL